MDDKILTILTPTYNRKNFLKRLYDSLCKQTVMEFEWLIIDDGSTDGTEQLVQTFENRMFQVNYVKKENGGKHTAINVSHDFIHGELVLIVDSDDALTDNAVNRILYFYEKYKTNLKVACWSFLKEDWNCQMPKKVQKKQERISNYVSYRINKHIIGDCAEVIRTDVLKKYDFPVVKSERFMLESWLWNQMALDGYDTVYIDEVIYKFEYLQDGLTKSARKLRMQNPIGSMIDAKQYLINPHVCLLVKIKMMLLFWVYGFCSHMNFFEIAKQSGQKAKMLFVLPAGYILYRIWERKYLYD